MKLTAPILLLLISSLGCAARTQGLDRSTTRFQTFLQRWEKAQEQFINGDPTAWNSDVTPGQDATIFGAFGGYEKGADVGPRYEWAASQYVQSGATKTIEYLSISAAGELAVTVSIERDRAQTKGQREPADRALRVTQVFRWEEDSWKLLHRHADPMLEKKAPSEN